MPCCKAEKYGWCKDLPVVKYRDEEGKEYCVFHAPVGKKDVNVGEFNKLVYERINFAIRKKQLCDLSGTIFEWDISFDQFKKDNPLPTIWFSTAEFIGETNFEQVTFNEADFYRAVFNEESNFKSATFNLGVNFWGGHFQRRGIFLDAIFEGKAGFRGTTFKKESIFTSASFGREADFAYAVFTKGDTLEVPHSTGRRTSLEELLLKKGRSGT